MRDWPNAEAGQMQGACCDASDVAGARPVRESRPRFGSEDLRRERSSRPSLLSSGCVRTVIAMIYRRALPRSRAWPADAKSWRN